MSKWIRKDDRVVAISGNEKGNAGKVLARKNDKIIVEGLNKRKKHLRRNQKTQTAQIIEIEKPIHVSNLKICDENNKPLKIKIKIEKDGSKDIYYLKDNKKVVFRTIKKRVD
jgi:large subunit ribosomal protein L24